MEVSLIITSQVSRLPNVDGLVYEYRIDSGKIVSKDTIVLNNEIRLQQIASNMSEPYTDAIAGVHDHEVWKGAFDQAVGPLFYLSDISAKRTEFLESFDALCSAVLLRELLSETPPDKIIVIGKCYLKRDTLVSLFPQAKIIFCRQPLNVLQLLRPLILNIIFFVKKFTISLMSWLILGRHECQLAGSRYFVSRFPGRLNLERHEQKYGRLVRKCDWYIAALLMDGLHQNLSFFSWFKNALSIKTMKNTVVVDAFDRPVDAVEGLCCFLKLYQRALPINIQFTIEELAFGQIIKEEFLWSLVRTPRLVSLSRSYDRLFKTLSQYNPRASVVYYLHEYPFGRMITSLLSNRHQNFRSIAMQHGPSSKTKMVYQISEKDLFHPSKPIAMPNAVLAEDRQSQSLYYEAGYKKVICMIEPPRLGRSSGVKNKSINKDRSVQLIAPGLHDSSIVLDLMIDRMVEKRSQSFLLKFHPKANLKRLKLDRLPQNCRVVTDPIEDLLQIVSKVFVSYSSVGEEAKSYGVDVEFLLLPGRVSQL